MILVAPPVGRQPTASRPSARAVGALSSRDQTRLQRARSRHRRSRSLEIVFLLGFRTVCLLRSLSVFFLSWHQPNIKAVTVFYSRDKLCRSCTAFKVFQARSLRYVCIQLQAMDGGLPHRGQNYCKPEYTYIPVCYICSETENQYTCARIVP